MKQNFFLLLLLTSGNSAVGQFPVSVDSFYNYIKGNSIYRNSVNWTTIDNNFSTYIKTAKSLNDTANCFVKVFDALGDYHSNFNLNGKYYSNNPSFDDTTLSWLNPLVLKSRETTNIIFAKKIFKQIAYIRIPSIQAYSQIDINKYSQAIFDTIAKLSSTSYKGFIIDLRLNGGGNIYPMLTGLSNFIDNSTVAYETDYNDTTVREWKIKNRNFFIGGYQTTNLVFKSDKKLNNIPVVVLTGPVTMSSGSMVAIAFKNRPNTITVGEPTADGYSTSNGYFQFAPALTGNLASFYVADRKKIIYKNSVTPDKVIYRGDNFDNLLLDKKIVYAIKWLNKK